MSDNGKGIYEAIPKVMAEIGSVAKSRKNPQQGYAFRGIDDMYNAVQPAMVKHGVFCAPEVTERIREERPARSGGTLFYTTLTVRHRFFAADGSYVDVTTVGEAMDSGDKSTNKAMSAAMKYALIELFSIPTEEEKDTEAQTPDPAPLPPPETRAKPQSVPARTPEQTAATKARLVAECATCPSLAVFKAKLWPAIMREPRDTQMACSEVWLPRKAALQQAAEQKEGKVA